MVNFVFRDVEAPSPTGLYIHLNCGTSRLGNNVGTGVPDGPKKASHKTKHRFLISSVSLRYSDGPIRLALRESCRVATERGQHSLRPEHSYLFGGCHVVTAEASDSWIGVPSPSPSVPPPPEWEAYSNRRGDYSSFGLARLPSRSQININHFLKSLLTKEK